MTSDACKAARLLGGHWCHFCDRPVLGVEKNNRNNVGVRAGEGNAVVFVHAACLEAKNKADFDSEFGDIIRGAKKP